MSPSTTLRRIGTLRETSLHAALKHHLAQPGDQFEVAAHGFVADLRRANPDRDPQLIEVQTQGFTALQRKLPRLLEHGPVRLVHPIALEKWIVRVDAAGRPLGRRRSPRRGALADLFRELVSIPALPAHPNLTLTVLLTREEEVRAPAPRSRRRWRRDYRVVDRRLLEVVQAVDFQTPQDFLAFIPVRLPQPFTSRALAEALGVSTDLGQKITYCLRRMGVLAEAGTAHRARLYQVRPQA